MRKFHSKLINIALHLSVWAFFILIPVILFDFPKHSLFEILFHTTTIILVFYINMLFFIPEFLSKGKVYKYITALFITTLICFLAAFISVKLNLNVKTLPEIIGSNEKKIIQIYDSLNLNDKIINKDDFLKKLNKINEDSKLPFPARTVLSILFAFGISTSLKVTQQWLKNEKQKKEIENQKLNAELLFLKSQVNPHFLFNTLNSIYSLAYKKSDKTADAVVKLSNMLRYMLYNTEKKLVPLENEIDYLYNYIDLQKLRIYENVKITFKTEGDYKLQSITPLLLIPFVENAFKHGIDNINDCFIDIFLQIENNDLFFKVTNSIPPDKQTSKDKNSGIGLQNIQTWLKHVYPDNHLLLINENNNIFSIKLTLRLSSNELSDN